MPTYTVSHCGHSQWKLESEWPVIGSVAPLPVVGPAAARIERRRALPHPNWDNDIECGVAQYPAVNVELRIADLFFLTFLHCFKPCQLRSLNTIHVHIVSKILQICSAALAVDLPAIV